MWFFLPCGFFSAVWCQTPDRFEYVDAFGNTGRNLFPNGAMMIRARSDRHLESLIALFAKAVQNSEAVMEEMSDEMEELEKNATFADKEEAVLSWAFTFLPIVEQPDSDYRYRFFHRTGILHPFDGVYQHADRLQQFQEGGTGPNRIRLRLCGCASPGMVDHVSTPDPTY